MVCIAERDRAGPDPAPFPRRRGPPDARGPLSTADELRAARARLVAAGDGERRRIERALHDGVQQDLVAVSVRLQLARRLAGTDLAAGLELLEEIERDVLDALDRLRTLANEIYPSLLDSRGLPDALRGAAAAAGVSATVEAAGVGRFPAQVEAAAYFCCRSLLEAVAAHRGPGARATIRIREEGAALRLEVDGVGTGPGGAAERLGAARDRIEALGGALSVDPAPGGATRVSATVPLGYPPSER